MNFTSYNLKLILEETLGNFRESFYSPVKFTVVAAVCVLVILSKIYKVLFRNPHRLSKKVRESFVELPSLRFIGPLHHFFLNRHDIGKLLSKWRVMYGPRTRVKFFGTDILILHDTQLLKTLLTSSDIGHVEKAEMAYNTVVVGTAFNGLLTMPAKAWAPHRKALHPLFTHEAIKSYVAIYKKHAESLVMDIISLDDTVDTKSSTYGTLIHLKSLDIITEILVGVPFESVLGKQGALKFYHDMQNIFKIASDRNSHKIWKSIPICWHFDPQKKELEKCIHDFEAAVLKVRNAHVEKDETKFALDLMVKSKWTDDEILAEMATLIVGGHDTVSSNFSLHVWLLALEQEHQLICQKEVDELFDRLEESGEELTLKSLNELKYVERCVKESLRIFPSTTLGTTREIKTELKLNEDLVLVPGTLVTYMPYVLHRDPEVFPDPEKFDPDRFLPENVKNRSPYAYLPFSAGPRNCLGWKAALVELTVLSAVLLRHFHLTTTDTREDIKIGFRFMLHPQKEPKVQFNRRR